MNALNLVNAQPWNWEINYKEKNQNRGRENAKDKYQWDRTWSSWSSQILLVGQVMAQPLQKTGWWLLTRLNLDLPCNLTSSPPGTDTTEMHLLVSPKDVQVLRTSLFRAPTWKLQNCSLTVKWANEFQYIHMMEYYIEVKNLFVKRQIASPALWTIWSSRLLSLVQCRMQPETCTELNRHGCALKKNFMRPDGRVNWGHQPWNANVTKQ